MGICVPQQTGVQKDYNVEESAEKLLTRAEEIERILIYNM